MLLLDVFALLVANIPLTFLLVKLSGKLLLLTLLLFACYLCAIQSIMVSLLLHQKPVELERNLMQVSRRVSKLSYQYMSTANR